MIVWDFIDMLMDEETPVVVHDYTHGKEKITTGEGAKDDYCYHKVLEFDVFCTKDEETGMVVPAIYLKVEESKERVG